MRADLYICARVLKPLLIPAKTADWRDDRIPHVAGSIVAGWIRANLIRFLADDASGQETVRILFGAVGSASSPVDAGLLTITDAAVHGTSGTHTLTSTRVERQTGTAEKGTLWTAEAVDPGAALTFAIQARLATHRECAAALQLLRMLRIKREWQIGRLGHRGFGLVRIETIGFEVRDEEGQVVRRGAITPSPVTPG